MGIIAGTALGGRLASIDALSLIWQASWLVQLVIGLLALASVFSWAIILAKWRELRRAEQDSEAFLEVYQEGSLDAAYQLARNLDRSPLAAMFVSAYAEFNRMTRFGGKGKPGALSEAQLRALERQLGWAGSRSSRPRAAPRRSSASSAPSSASSTPSTASGRRGRRASPSSRPASPRR